LFTPCLYLPLSRGLKASVVGLGLLFRYCSVVTVLILAVPSTGSEGNHETCAVFGNPNWKRVLSGRAATTSFEVYVGRDSSRDVRLRELRSWCKVRHYSLLLELPSSETARSLAGLDFRVLKGSKRGALYFQDPLSHDDRVVIIK
jgi:hypothetical protein